MAKVHVLKTSRPYFKSVKAGNKHFEIRRNDRNFKKGDRLILVEVTSLGATTGRYIDVTVGYVLQDNPELGLAEGFAVLSLNPSRTLCHAPRAKTDRMIGIVPEATEDAEGDD
ncbi:MAG: DUF3850 domain-containing protein [Fimbriimonadaceae bacterium]|nr:DUF3850 domain-containing protein [Fimbriimonadaceae bacterium]QYK56620.1 MAG: DUF3850 domain-containing protein [Fimbriimonadaceae bacterium]